MTPTISPACTSTSSSRDRRATYPARAERPRPGGRGARASASACAIAPAIRRDELVVVEAAARDVGDELAVAQHDDPVGELDDLVEAVRDEDDAGAALGDLAHGARRGSGPRRRAATAVGSSSTSTLPGWAQPCERAGDRDDRALGGGQLGDRPAHVERRAEARRSAARRRRRSLAARRGQQRARRRDAASSSRFSTVDQLGDQAEVLVDEVEADVLAVGAGAESDVRARVGRVEPGEDLDERRLAGAVLADERDDLAGADGQWRRRRARAGPGTSWRGG